MPTATSDAEATVPPGRAPVLGVVLDVVILSAFAFGGVRTHSGEVVVTQVLGVLGAFLIGYALSVLALATIASRRSAVASGDRAAAASPGPGWPAPFRISRITIGIALGLVTTFLGLLVRVMIGDGVSGAFPLVAAAFILSGFLLWRMVALVVVKTRRVHPSR